MIRNSTPELYGAWLEGVVRRTAAAYDPEDQLVFINAWNEWGEGTYLEPDVKHGRAYLEETRDALRRAGAKVDKKGAETDTPPPASPEERSRRLQAKYEDLQRRYNEQLAFEEELQREAGRTADYAEGVRAFVEKRKAEFVGR